MEEVIPFSRDKKYDLTQLLFTGAFGVCVFFFWWATIAWGVRSLRPKFRTGEAFSNRKNNRGRWRIFEHFCSSAKASVREERRRLAFGIHATIVCVFPGSVLDGRSKSIGIKFSPPVALCRTPGLTRWSSFDQYRCVKCVINSRAEQSRAEQSGAEQSRAEQSRAEQSRERTSEQ